MLTTRQIVLLNIAVALLVLAGCATSPSTSLSPATVAVADTRTDPFCDDVAALDDNAASSRLDIPVLMLSKIREIAKVDTRGVCQMSADDRNRVMLVYRNQFRDPNRKKLKAPAKEFLSQWDAGDDGHPPSATKVLAAEGARRRMVADGLQASSNTVGKATAAADAGINSTQWRFIGPGNIGGRIRTILIDPRNPNRLLLGAASGGVWISNDAGQSFAPSQDFLGNLAIGTLAYDPGNADVVYAGTGESFAGLPGIGVFRSTDSGVTWQFMNSTSTDTAVNPQGNSWVYINRIAVSATNANLLLVATFRGIFRSVDGGNSWTQVVTGAIDDLKFDPNNAQTLLAGAEDGSVHRSTDAGATWQRIGPLFSTPLTGRSSTARAEIAWAPATPNLVFLSMDNNKGEVWRSTDAGVTWELLSNPKHLNDQGDYDNAIWVSPVDSNHILVGGLDLYRSMDGGPNFTRISSWQSAGGGLPQPHADHHAIVSPANYSTDNPVVYFGNDGGLYRSSNIFLASSSGTSSWINLNNGLGVTQFYGGAGRRSAGGKIIGGTQDNGTLFFSEGTTWRRYFGGDGGNVAIDPQDDYTVYGEYVYASIHRALNLAADDFICDGITDALKGTSSNQPYCGLSNPDPALANFIAPFILDPNNRNRMLVGANSLWASNNVRDPNPTWKAIKPPVSLASQSRHYLNAIAVQEGNSDVIWVGHNGSNSSTSPTHLYKTDNGLSESPTWKLVSVAGMPNAAVNRITIDPDNPDRVLVGFSGFATNRLWQTLDGGNTWASITGNLPQVTVHDIKRHPLRPLWLYAATANGVYTSENGGATWSTANDGPASVRVRELFWYDNHTLVAATYGRGMFSATLPADEVTLTVNNVGSGQGTVLSSPSGLNCKTLCSFGFRPSTSVTLRAAPAPGSRFVGWTGGCAGSGGCVVTTNAATSVSAVFEAIRAPLVDFTHDGQSDLLFREANGSVTAYIMNTISLVNTATVVAAGSGWSVTHTGDFNGDGKTDLVLRHTDGRVALQLMDGITALSLTTLRPANSGWTVTHVADASGDGKSDLVWRHTDDSVEVWLMDGATPKTTALLLGPGNPWTVTQVADLNGDGRADLIGRHTDGATAALLLDGVNGLQSAAFRGANSGWTISHVGDFDGDGKADLLWRGSDGAVEAWLMDGLQPKAKGLLLGGGGPWTVTHVADLNGDGRSDLIGVHTDGSFGALLMNGLNGLASAILRGPGSGGTLTHTADLNGDGKADLVIRNSNGSIELRLMDGLTNTGSTTIRGAGTAQVVPPQ